MEKFYEVIDPILMGLFRLVPDPIIGFFVGTFLLALTSVVIGQTTLSIAFLFNRKYVENLNNDLIKWNNLSITLLKLAIKKLTKPLTKRQMTPLDGFSSSLWHTQPHRCGLLRSLWDGCRDGLATSPCLYLSVSPS